MVDLEKLKLARAEDSHFQRLMDISEGIYDGLDYFPHVFHEWVKIERDSPNERRSVVLLDGDGAAIGYQSFLFQDNGNRVLAQALRIDGSLKGMGVGKRFMELCRSYLLDLNPETLEVKAVWHKLIPKSKQVDPSMGKMCGTRMARCFEVHNPMEFARKFEGYNKTNLHVLTADDLASVMDKYPSDAQKFLASKYLTLNWIPYYITSGQDVKRVKPLESELRIFSDKAKGQLPSSISFFSQPYKVSIGYSFCMDLFVNTEDEVRDHIMANLSVVSETLISGKDSQGELDPKGVTKAGLMHVWFHMDPKFFPFVDVLAERELGLTQLATQNYGSKQEEDIHQRERPDYFIYEKKI